MILLLACTGADPQLDPLREALAAYDAGRASLEAGRPDDAITSLTTATELDPRSAELWLWLGKAHADAGDHLSAIRSADKALGLAPDMLEARYDRACWRAQFGDLEGAAQDLSLAAQDARLDPFFVAMDPDLDPLRNDASYGHVVAKPVLPVRVEAPTEPAFLGSEVTVAVGVLHPVDQVAEFAMPVPAGPLSLRKVVEDHVVEGPMQRTELRLTWVATGAGTASVGPWTISAGVFKGIGDTASFELLAPEGHEAQAGDASLRVPSALLVDEVTRDGDRVTAWGEPGDQLTWAATQVVTLELRERGQPVQVGWTGTLAAGETVTLTRGRQELWSRTP